VHELDILLLLNDSGTECGTLVISRRLQIDRTMVEAIIKSLETRRLVIYRDVHGERLYRIDSSNPAMASTLNELGKWYSTHRVRILTMIYGKPLNNIQTFADAFRSRKDEGD
jgi:hypothetical protein